MVRCIMNNQNILSIVRPFLISFTIIICSAFPLYATDQSGISQDTNMFRFYLDADMSGARASGISIERGIRTALGEIENNFAGYDIELVILDHRGNSRRSLSHLKQYLADSTALALFTGLHSPPVLSNLKFIHDNEILVLDPWAAQLS